MHNVKYVILFVVTSCVPQPVDYTDWKIHMNTSLPEKIEASLPNFNGGDSIEVVTIPTEDTVYLLKDKKLYQVSKSGGSTGGPIQSTILQLPEGISEAKQIFIFSGGWAHNQTLYLGAIYQNDRKPAFYVLQHSKGWEKCPELSFPEGVNTIKKVLSSSIYNQKTHHVDGSLMVYCNYNGSSSVVKLQYLTNSGKIKTQEGEFVDDDPEENKEDSESGDKTVEETTRYDKIVTLGNGSHLLISTKCNKKTLEYNNSKKSICNIQDDLQIFFISPELEPADKRIAIVCCNDKKVIISHMENISHMGNDNTIFHGITLSSTGVTTSPQEQDDTDMSEKEKTEEAPKTGENHSDDKFKDLQYDHTLVIPFRDVFYVLVKDENDANWAYSGRLKPEKNENNY